MCCLRLVCAADASAQRIVPTNYDQSCAVDSDCVAVGFGDPCTQCLYCANGAINETSEAQYRADRAKTPESPICFCAFAPAGPCCVDGMCQVGSQCPLVPVPPEADAAAD
jgi:hypothetical protein